MSPHDCVLATRSLVGIQIRSVNERIRQKITVYMRIPTIYQGPYERDTHTCVLYVDYMQPSRLYGLIPSEWKHLLSLQVGIFPQ